MVAALLLGILFCADQFWWKSNAGKLGMAMVTNAVGSDEIGGQQVGEGAHRRPIWRSFHPRDI